MTGPLTTIDLALRGGDVPVRALEDGPSFWVLASTPDARWPLELLRSGSALIRHGGTEARLTVELVSDPATTVRILERFRSSVGPQQFAAWFPVPGRLLRLTTASTGTAPSYDRWLESEFDATASTYASRVWSNPYELAARARSIRFLSEIFPAHSHLLELGAGAGLETLPLLRAGHAVTAVDISASMLAQLQARALGEGLAERLTILQARAGRLGALAPGGFDGAFSTFGALNCEPDLTNVAAQLAARMAEGAPLVAGVYNRTCLAEIAAYTLSGRPRRALARLHAPVEVGYSRFSVDWYAYNRYDIERAFAPWFAMFATEGIGLLTPPPEVRRPWVRWPRFVATTLRWDAALGRRPTAAHLADQLLIGMRRTAVPASGDARVVAA